MSTDLGVRLQYIESRLGLLGQDHPRYWKSYPEPPSWINDNSLWLQAKRTTLKKEALTLLNQIDQELSVTERCQYEDRLRTVEQAIWALDKEANPSIESGTADEKGSVILVSRKKGIQSEVPSFNVHGEVDEDDYTGFSEIVQSVWLKASNWTSLLKNDEKPPLTSLSLLSLKLWLPLATETGYRDSNSRQEC
eukprot:Protomagalhaensia_sp_Gyna_25__2747@NODE_2580_length_1001_cov_147_556133_g2142_i0_p1_GENE_NODE_2580_length_1001_cov_147_556133_g2142_i0NODE_2580_length_1001_cov_147_556133_g2142_i0_p1_ORF_typecomplete_len193_score39_42_NODE_2580_length_1001_cov_147_556133_g2142_i0365943